jgi:hypothetical protein
LDLYFLEVGLQIGVEGLNLEVGLQIGVEGLNLEVVTGDAHSHPARAAAALSFDPAPGVQDPLRGVPNLGKIDRACFISSVNLFSTFHRITGALLNLLFHVQGGGKMSQRHCSRGSKFEQFHDGLCSCGCTTAEDPRATTRQRLQWQSRR